MEKSTLAIGSKAWLNKCTSNEYLSFYAKFCGKTQASIAKEIGYKTQSALSQAFRTKKMAMPIPIDVIWKLSKAVGCNPYMLREKVFRERQAEYYEGEKKAGLYVLSDAEKEIVEKMRDLQFREILTEEDKEPIFKILKERADKQA